MKKRFLFPLTMLLAALLAAGCGCGSKDQPPAASAAHVGKEDGIRTILSWNGKSLYSAPVLTPENGFEDVRINRTDDSGDSPSSSLVFSFEKQEDEGYLTVTGSVFMGADASSFLDPFQEDAEDNLSVPQEDAAEPTDEVSAADETPDEVSAADDAANEQLKAMMKELLAATESGAVLEIESSGGLDWTYGFSKHAGEKAGNNEENSVLNFCACGEGDGFMLYLNAGASLDGYADPGSKLENVQAEFTDWFRSLTTEADPGSFLIGKDSFVLPAGDKTLTGPEPDFLRVPGAEIIINSGGGRLAAQYSGSIDGTDSESGAWFTASLKNRSAATEEELSAAASVSSSGEELAGSALNWKTSTEEKDGSTSLLAVAESDGQTLIFTLETSFENTDGAKAASETACSAAKGWLSALKLT